MKKLNNSVFSRLDAYNSEGCDWATKEYDLIAKVPEIKDIDVDLISFAFANIYNHFLHISMNYHEGDVEAWLEDFYGREVLNDKWDMMWEAQSIIYTALYDIYGRGLSKIYDSLVSSVNYESEDYDGDKIIINPIEREGEHQVMCFVVSRFRY